MQCVYPLTVTSNGLAATSAPATDCSLMEAIAAGDRRAMRTLYMRHHTRVYRFLLRLLQNEASAEELLSDVFLDAWRHAGRFEGRSQVSTWLIGIARHKALGALRKHTTDTLDEAAAERIEDPADGPEVVLAKRETGTILRGCLDELSAAHREIIDLVYYHGKTIDEVAALIGVPTGTVKTRMFYARKQLRAAMAARGETGIAGTGTLQ